MKFWFNGLPMAVIDAPVEEGGLKFWFNGLPVSGLFPSVVIPPAVTAYPSALLIPSF